MKSFSVPLQGGAIRANPLRRLLQSVGGRGDCGLRHWFLRHRFSGEEESRAEKWKTRPGFDSGRGRAEGTLTERRNTSSKGLESCFGCSAYRAAPVIGQLFKPGARRDLPLPISLVGVVDIAAVGHLTLPHVFGIGHESLLFVRLHVKSSAGGGAQDSVSRSAPPDQARAWKYA